NADLSGVARQTSCAIGPRWCPLSVAAVAGPVLARSPQSTTKYAIALRYSGFAGARALLDLDSCSRRYGVPEVAGDAGRPGLCAIDNSHRCEAVHLRGDGVSVQMAPTTSEESRSW